MSSGKRMSKEIPARSGHEVLGSYKEDHTTTAFSKAGTVISTGLNEKPDTEHVLFDSYTMPQRGKTSQRWLRSQMFIWEGVGGEEAGGNL